MDSILTSTQLQLMLVTDKNVRISAAFYTYIFYHGIVYSNNRMYAYTFIKEQYIPLIAYGNIFLLWNNILYL